VEGKGVQGRKRHRHVHEARGKTKNFKGTRGGAQCSMPLTHRFAPLVSSHHHGRIILLNQSGSYTCRITSQLESDVNEFKVHSESLVIDFSHFILITTEKYIYAAFFTQETIYSLRFRRRDRK
jgi:hypothetical protein